MIRPEPIYLPWCPQCGATGSQPGQKRRGKKRAPVYYCMGADPQHPRAKMVMIRYEPKEFTS